MALVVQGALVVDGTRFRYLGWQSQRRNSLGIFNDFNLTGQDRVKSNAIAMHMLFYPLIYIIPRRPLSFSNVGLVSPQSTTAARNTPISPNNELPPSWKITPQTMPTELPMLHITTPCRSSISM
ncbi:hypothetical protein BT96DRAFT_26819 [Gymnopus androsaceus JB14]|uniref:Uncharacterized protein n=1 Tax=Gymnopus androsaceus JB14 TaxID=1447944 RepID=A0A6A4IC47_9AGAR|nr:hypothetical protein BT96DRAFT_26819 [Gymnopus androsaceus JB14]